MASLWRALAAVWLGGVGSPALMDPAPLPDLAIEEPARASPLGEATARDDFDTPVARVIGNRSGPPSGRPT